nr:hypothetical protein [Pandoravirus aubagnensis]
MGAFVFQEQSLFSLAWVHEHNESIAVNGTRAHATTLFFSFSLSLSLGRPASWVRLALERSALCDAVRHQGRAYLGAPPRVDALVTCDDTRAHRMWDNAARGYAPHWKEKKKEKYLILFLFYF